VIYTETLNAGAVCNESFTQAMIINPPITLDIFGLNDGDILCRNNNANVSQGNLVSFDGSVTGSGIFSLDDDTDFTSVNTTLNGTVNTISGKATINLLSAYNAASDASDPRQVYLQYRYTAPGCTGPSSVTKGFEISPPPPIAFDFSLGNSPGNGEIFCYDGTPAQLKTIQNTNVSLSGYGTTDSGAGNGVATFNPALAFNTSVSNGGALNSKQNINVTARIVDGVGCANITSVTYTVNPVPQAQVDFDSDEFCYEDAPGLITGQQVKSWYSIEYLGGTTPYTEDIGDINNPQSQISFNPKTRFDHAITLGASALTPVNFNVYYYVADADNCTTSVGPTLVSVANRIDVRIAGLDNDDIFCSNDTKGEKSLTFTPYPADASKREFTINGETQSITTDKYTFKPPLLGGDFLLEYVVFSGENNCSNTNAVSVKVLPSPKAIFKPEPACDGDLIDFNADGTSNLSSAIYTWVMPDLVLSGQNIQHRFQGTNLFGVNLKVQYPAYNNDPTLVCQDSLRLDQVVGAIPQNLAFKYFNVCEDDQTAFGIQPDIPVSKVSWDFGDGVATPLGFSAEQVQAVTSTAGTYQSPVHTFQGAGNYNVIVTGKTADIFGGCERTEAHSISILNNWAPSPAEPFYEMSQINGGNGYWVEEDLAGNSTWDFNTPTKKRIILNEMAWVTGPVEPYKEEDISYVNSPCFDLSSFSRPVISLNHWADTDLSDGAVVQYSIDGGENWTRLGNVASGLAWYNQLTIQSNPGGQQDLTSGWSTSNQRGWNTGKHTLDVIPFPRNQVRFRVAFSSFKNRDGRDGFAFNNVVIEERNRTILVENFTQLNQEDNNEGFKDFKAFNGAFNPNEVVKLQYHHSTATPGAIFDELHFDNPVDQDARAAFYGVTNPVRAFIDGGFGQLPASVTFPSTALNTYFELRSLVTSPVDISIDFLPESDPAQLNVKAVVRATSDLGEPGNYNVFIAIAEQSVLEQIYVLRKFLPNAAGTPLTALSESDPAQEIIASYDMRHVTRLPNGEFAPFAVIVFVQHLETKDVLQTTMRQDGTASPEIVTGLEISFDNYIRVYPNPADDIMNIILPSPVTEHTPIKLFDSFGRQVYAGTFNQGEHLTTLDTKLLSAGVYLIQISTDKGLVQKKVMIVHE
ncbi:MAG TPA: T9SS type A sorting domain-containing protein, partial [Chryseosolibacter sp.]